MRIDDCSGLRGHRLKSCSRCGHQFDGLRLTRLNCDQLNAIKDKESQFGFRWKLSDWAVGEVVKVEVCPSCYSEVVNLIDTNEMVEKLTTDYSSKSQDFLTKQLNIPFYRCQICHKELPKNDFMNIPHYIITDIVMNPDDYFVRKSRSEKQALLDHISRSAYGYVKVCRECYEGLHHEYRSNQVQRLKKTAVPDTPIYINGKSHGGVKQDIVNIPIEDLYKYTQFDELNDSKKRVNQFLDAALYAMKFKNYIKTEERKMKKVNETKKNAFAIERNYDGIDRKLFKLEETEPGDIIRLATDAEKRVYMVVDTSKVKERIKAKENEAANSIWCVCMQTQEVVELDAKSLIYVYNPDYIALKLGRFLEDA